MIPVNRPALDGNERQYLLECIDSGWVSSEGPFVARFENAFAKRLGRRHAIAVSSGTAALDAALAALRLQAGDEVIVSAFTIISCVSAIVRAGATPVLVDCDPRTLTVDVDALRMRIGPRTRAIMPVHIYGLPADMGPILELAREHGLRVIEDAAEAIGVRYRDRECGSFGDASCMSFYANKHVTSGEGGMIFTDDDEVAARCRALRNLCFTSERRFVHEELGWNWRMCNLQAAVGLAQLERLDDTVARKREIGRLYQDLLADVAQVELPPEAIGDTRNGYWVFGLQLRDEVPFDAAEAAQRLLAMGVQTRPFFWPMHEQPVLRRMGLFDGERYPVAERAARRGFYLPSGSGTSDDEIRSAARATREVLS